MKFPLYLRSIWYFFTYSLKTSRNYKHANQFLCVHCNSISTVSSYRVNYNATTVVAKSLLIVPKLTGSYDKDLLKFTQRLTCDEETMCRLSVDQSMHSTFPWWPFRTRRDLIFNWGRPSSRWATTHTAKQRFEYILVMSGTYFRQIHCIWRILCFQKQNNVQSLLLEIAADWWDQFWWSLRWTAANHGST